MQAVKRSLHPRQQRNQSEVGTLGRFCVEACIVGRVMGRNQLHDGNVENRVCRYSCRFDHLVLDR